MNDLRRNPSGNGDSQANLWKEITEALKVQPAYLLVFAVVALFVLGSFGAGFAKGSTEIGKSNLASFALALFAVVIVVQQVEKTRKVQQTTSSIGKMEHNEEKSSPRLPKLNSGWTLCLIGQKQGEILNNVSDGLRRPFSESGDGKELSSGVAYWGIIPTRKWVGACCDQTYPLMARIAKHFDQILPELIKDLNKPMHYVSFGIGDGKLDRKLVGKLKVPKKGLHYFPVDFSPEMLQVGIEEVKNFRSVKVIPTQVDFSDAENTMQLRQTIAQFVGSDPILFGLTGNTIANFKDDRKLLKNLSSILRQDDKFLLGFSFTDKLSLEVAKQAAREYEGIKLFKPFLTSGMLQNTNLSVENDALHFEGSVEEDKSLLIKMYFQNNKGDTQFRLPEGQMVDFPGNDTIRLYISRKYSKQGIEEMMEKSDLEIIKRYYSETYLSSHFGIAFLLVGKKPNQRL